MKCFFTTLLHVDLIEFNDEYVEIMPGLYLTNNYRKVEHIFTEEVQFLIGELEFQHIYNSKAILYYEYTDEDIEAHFKGLSNLDFLDMILLWINDFLKNSWVLKDNSIFCDTAYLIDNYAKGDGEASNQRLNYVHTLSTGGMATTKFSLKEILEIAALHDKIESHLVSKSSSSFNFSMVKNYSRLGRFLFFIKNAREARNLGHKVLNYSSALETLLSTDNFEIAHKIGERTAFFLKDLLPKFETYSVIKKSYEIRSKLTHGASIDQKLIDQMPDISKELDEILRKIFNKIFNDENIISLFESDNNRINTYFNGLIFE